MARWVIPALLGPGSLFAQAPPFTCNYTAGAPPVVREGGLSERIADTFLTCSGGFLGQQFVVNIQVFLNTTYTGRINQGPTLTVGPTVHRGQPTGSNSVVWPAVTLTAPGTIGTVVASITGMRARATTPTTPVVSFLTTSGATSVPVNNPQQTVAITIAGMPIATAVRRPDDSASFVAQIPNCQSNKTTVNAQTAADFNVKFTENDSTIYRNAAGVETQSSRLVARFFGIPAGVSLYVTAAPVAAGTTLGPGTAALTATDANGAGGFTPLPATHGPYRQLPIVSGAAIAVWEMINANDFNTESMSFGVVVSMPANPAVTAGITMRAGLGPLSLVNIADDVAPIPRFADLTTPVNAAAIVNCAGGPPTFDVSTTNLTFNEPGSQVLSITTNQPGIPYTATVAYTGAVQFLRLSMAAGSIPASLAVTAIAGVPQGLHAATITIASANAQPPTRTVAVFFNAPAPPPPGLDVQPLRFQVAVPRSAGLRRRLLTFTNRGATPATYVLTSLSTATGGSWLSVTTPRRTLAGGERFSTNVVFDPGAVPAGVHQGRLVFRTLETGDTTTIAVFLEVSAAGDAILLSHEGTTFTVLENGPAPPPQSLQIVTDGTGGFAWQAAIVYSGPPNTWLALSQAAGQSRPGAPSQVDLVVNQRGVPAGAYTAVVEVRAAGVSNSPRIFLVTLNVLGAGRDPGPLVSPAGLVFVAPVGGPGASPRTVEIFNLSGAPFTFGAALQGDTAPFSFTTPQGTAVNPGARATVVVAAASAQSPAAVYRASLALQFSTDQMVRTVDLALIVAPGIAPTASRQAGREAAGCVPTSLVIVSSTLFGLNFNVPAGPPIQAAVEVRDSCGELFTNADGAVVAIPSTAPDASPMNYGSSGKWSKSLSFPVTPNVFVTFEAVALNDALRAEHTVYGSAPQGVQTNTLRTQQSSLTLAAGTSPSGQIGVFTNGVSLNYEVSADVDWLDFTPATGTVAAAVRLINVSLLSNLPPGPRTATLTITGGGFSVSVTINASGGAGVTSRPLVVPQVADGGEWKTTVVVISADAAAAQFTLRFFTAGGQPLSLPVAGIGTVAEVSGTVAPGGFQVVETEGTAPAVVAGWAELTSANRVTGYAIFRSRSPRQDSEGVVPLPPAAARRLLIPFDNTSGFATSVAVANADVADCQSGAVRFTDQNGATLLNAPFQLASRNRDAFELAGRYPASANRRGLVEFSCANVDLYMVGFRFNPQFAFTSLDPVDPAAAPAATRRIAPQVADGDGWSTISVLANLEAAQAAATVAFYAQNGAALALPVQGDGMVSTVSRNVAAGGVSTVETNGVSPLRQGWAEVTGAGKVVGMAIFGFLAGGAEVRYSEGAVPLPAPGGRRLLLFFDNTGGFDTAVAIANPENVQTVIGARFRDATGADFGGGSLTVAARSREAFQIAAPGFFPLTAGRRGLIDLTSSSADVYVVVLRFNPRASFTSLTPVVQ
jgi:hypothetical protein